MPFSEKSLRLPPSASDRMHSDAKWHRCRREAPPPKKERKTLSSPKRPIFDNFLSNRLPTKVSCVLSTTQCMVGKKTALKILLAPGGLVLTGRQALVLLGIALVLGVNVASSRGRTAVRSAVITLLILFCLLYCLVRLRSLSSPARCLTATFPITVSITDPWFRLGALAPRTACTRAVAGSPMGPARVRDTLRERRPPPPVAVRLGAHWARENRHSLNTLH